MGVVQPPWFQSRSCADRDLASSPHLSSLNGKAPRLITEALLFWRDRLAGVERGLCCGGLRFQASGVQDVCSDLDLLFVDYVVSKNGAC